MDIVMIVFVIVAVALSGSYLVLTTEATKFFLSQKAIVEGAPGNIYSPVSWFIWAEIAAAVGYIAYEDASGEVVRVVILHAIIAGFSLLIGIIGTMIFRKNARVGYFRALLEERFNSHSKWRLLAFVLANLMLYVYLQAPDKTSFWVTVALMIADFCALMPILLAVWAEPNQSGSSVPFFAFSIIALLALWTVYDDSLVCRVMPTYLFLANLLIALAIEGRRTDGLFNRQKRIYGKATR